MSILHIPFILYPVNKLACPFKPGQPAFLRILYQYFEHLWVTQGRTLGLAWQPKGLENQAKV